ncbi:hypothetical protein [Desulfolucanica intricata]|uniref:hypothetical protein n=1 Tax=Desulfolucanica intricata TaxID=1285191 RepID=UPI000836E4E8|nr:hypothetical protein [Desulfolucanica intricata]
MSFKQELKNYLYKVVTIIVNGETEEVIITSVHSDYIKAVGLDINRNLIVKTFPLNNSTSIIIRRENP